MKIDEIKTPEDILEFMKSNIKYGWIDINNEEHIGNMKNFRRLYRKYTIEETLKHGLGTCIEQVNLMHTLLDKIKIPNKMFCTRIYEGEDFNNLEEEAIEAVRDYVASFKAPYTHMHTLKNFILYTKKNEEGDYEMESIFMTIIENNREKADEYEFLGCDIGDLEDAMG